MDLTQGCVYALLTLYGTIECLKLTTYSSNSTETQYVPLLNKVKTPVMAELDLSKLGEQLKSFMKIEIEKVITEKIALESAKIYNKLENNLNTAIENFKTSMDAYTDDVLHNTSITMRMKIERKLNQTFARRVRRFRTIMHSDIRSTLQNLKSEIDVVLSESYNSSNAYNPNRRKLRKLSGKFKDLSKYLKDPSYDRKGDKKKVSVTRLSPESYSKDHKGKLFFTMFPIKLEKSGNWYVQFIITADTQTKVDFISEYANINRTVLITTGAAYIDIPSSVLTLGIGRTYTTVLIRADQLVTVVGFFGKAKCYSGCVSSSLIVLPLNELGTKYSLISLPNGTQDCGLMAIVTNTTVVIESASVGSIPVGSATIQPRQNFTLVLDYLEGFHIQTAKNLTGTKIYANEPVVVISGNKYTSLKEDCYRRFCTYYVDIIYETLIPADKWARHFIIPPIHNTSSVRIRIVSRNINTTIIIKDNFAWSITVHGDLIEVDLSEEFFGKSYFVSSSHPILMSLYTSTDNKGMTMMIVPGIEHFSKEYVIAPPNHYLIHTNYISIIIKSSDVDGLRFVGNLIPVESSVIMARNESFTIVVKKMTDYSVYKIRHVSKNAIYGVIVYGFGGSTAYGYPAGFRF
ncbi:unnamed protein product [Mytilus coruscus]|uniref:IgGFc-binding protein N-terminal domain-containing protein n=1 Tax=Mytilus coruscus TaxID=42192 RepID=A0A6J8BBQ4_MYTCO|nr:unnamed protein product [Mytilus coruscus]